MLNVLLSNAGLAKVLLSVLMWARLSDEVVLIRQIGVIKERLSFEALIPWAVQACKVMADRTKKAASSSATGNACLWSLLFAGFMFISIAIVIPVRLDPSFCR